jgi:hypothetical protein
MFKDIINAIFATDNREESEAIIEHYSRYWMDIPGTRGFKGENTVSPRPQFNSLFETVENPALDSVQSEHGEDFSEDEIAKLNELERNA